MAGTTAGSVTNTASVAGNEPDPDLTNNSSSVTVTITSFTDLTILNTPSAASVVVGSSFSFSVTVINVGNQAATNVVVTDTVPFVSAIGPPGFSCGIAFPTLQCNVGTLASGASVSLTTIATTATTPGTATSAASVTLNETDPTPGDNNARANLTVLPSAGTSERYILTDRDSPTVLEYDTATSTFQGSVHAGTTPHEIAISPNGRLAFVGDVNSNFVSVIDLTLNAEITRIRGVRASFHVALSGDGTKLVVPNINLDEVDIIDTSTFQIQRVSINGIVGDDPNNPNDIFQAGVVTAGNFAYIATGSNLTGAAFRVAVINLTTFAASSIPGTDVGFAGFRDQIAATPDGKFVIVPRRGPGQLLIIDATRNTLSQTISVGGQPFAIAITRDANDPNGVFGYVTRGGNLNVVDVLDLRVGSPTFGTLVPGAQITLPAPLDQSHVGITADGKRIIVVAFNPTAAQNNVFVLDTASLRTNPPPATAIVTQFRAGGALSNLSGIGVGLTQSQPPANAPVVGSVSTTPVTNPPSIVNDIVNTVHITGSGFVAGALVRVGSLDPIAAANVTSTGLDVTLPQFVPAQNAADVIVTNPGTGGVAGQSASGILHGALTITNGTAFQPANEVTVSTFGDNAVAIFNNVTQSITDVPTSPRPLGEAISVDGLRAYIGSVTGLGVAAVNVINLNTKTLEMTIALATDTFNIGQNDAIVTAPNPATGGPVEFLLTGFNNTTTNLSDLRVVLIDSDSTSPTFNTIVGSFACGAPCGNAFAGALAVTSDGHFAYANDANTGNLVIFNIQTGAVTVVPASAQSNPSPFQPHIEISQDNKSLVLLSNPANLLVFDIGTNPTNPTLLTTITGAPPTGFNPIMFGTFRVVGNHLYAYDGSQNVVQAFNFDRTANNFSQVASFVVPGNLGVLAPGLAVTPDGALLYLTLQEDDAITAIDNAKFLAGNPSPLVTKVRVGLTPSAIIISPGKALVASLAITKTASPTTVALGTTVAYTMIVTNSGPSSSTGVTLTDNVPEGLTFVSATPTQGTCSGNIVVTCNLGTLANGASASVTLIATATGGAGSFPNTASVTENETNPTPANATSSVTITVTNASVCPTATTIQWTGAAVPADNQWTTPTNWKPVDGSPARVPLATDNACIDTGFAGTTITLANSAQSVNSLTAASSFVLSGATTATSLTVANGSTFLNALTLNGAALNSGHLAINGLFTSSGTSSIGAPTAFLLANGGIAISGTLTVIGNTLVNSGPGTLNSGSIVQLSGGAALANSSSLAINSASIMTSSGSSVINRAGATMNVGNATISAPVTNLGTVNQSNGTLSLSGGYTQTSGTTALSGGNISTNSPLNINGGLLVGTGIISGGVSVASGGTVSPGFSPGKISLNGPTGVYTQSVTGAYNAEIGGLTAGTQYDQINVAGSGSASLNGILNVSLINGFVPAAGNSFTILNCALTGCLTGTFSMVNLPALSNGLRWTVTYGPTSVVLSVSATAAGCGAGTNQWTGTAGDNQWGTAGNWSNGAVPIAADNVCIGTAFSTPTITIGSLGAANQTIASLVANSTINFTSGPLTVTGAATFASALNITGGTLTLNGASTVQGPTNLSGGTLTGTGNATLTGLLTWTGGTMSGTGVTNANGGMSIPNVGVTLDTRTLNVAGVTTFGNATGGSNLSLFNGAVVNNLAGAIWSIVNGNGNGIIFNGGTVGTVNNAGTFQMTGGVSNSISVAFNNTGTVSANSGILSFTGSYAQTAGSTLLNGGSISAGITGLNINGGKLGGTGSITGNVSVTTGGLLSPGFSPGVITLNGAYGQSATGSYLVEIAGLTPDTQYDQLNLTNAVTVNGNTGIATLGGTLNVTLLNGFVPAVGNSFTIVTCAVTSPCINGTFATTNLPTLPAGLTWSITYNTNSVVLSVVAATSVSITKTASVTTAHLGGGNFTYTVTVTNNSSSPATGVTLTDPLPPAVTFVSAVVSPASQGTCSGATTVTCPLGTLANGASATVTITVTPVAIGSAVNTATVAFNGTGSNSASATVQIQGTADLALVKTAQPNPVNAGSPLSYTLTVTNNGPSPATGVVLTDALPPAATFVSAAPTQGTCSGATTITCALGTIPGIGTAGTVSVIIVATPTGSGPLTNTANVTANEFDPNPANNTSAATVTVIPIADLALTKTASPNPAGVGSNLTYTLTVTNNGPPPASGVTLIDTVPAGVTFVSATPSQGTCTTAVSCNLGALANAAKATVTIVVTPTAAGTVTNTATVSANEIDPVPTNNTATVSTTVTASADLALGETVAPNPVLLGGSNLTYTLTITNNGPSPATGVVLSDTLPVSATLVSATPSQGTCTSPLSTCAIGNLASGASATVLVVLKPTAAGTVTNSATVSANENDPNPANNSASASATVSPVADLSLMETATPQTAPASSNVTFSFTVTNNGPSAATGVTLTDTLPAGMVLVSATSSQGTCAPTVNCNLGTLANGATATLTVVAKAPLTPGTLNNTGNVTATEADPFPSNNTAVASVTVVASADMAVTISSSPNPAGVGVNLTFTMTITNNGPSPATGVTLAGTFTAGATFVSLTQSQGSCQGTTQINCSLGAMASGSTAVVTAVFTPTVAGSFGTSETVTANEPDPNQANNSATVSVNVLSSPVVTLSAASLNYASQPVGTPSTAQGVTLTNTSSALPLTNLSITAGGDFAQTNNCGTGLAAQSSCSIMVTFTPTATGTRTGAITISDNAVGSPQMVSLTGIGINAPAITLSPGSLIFSSRLVGSPSPPLTISMSNSGNATLNIASIAIAGTNSGDFSQTNTCGQTLAPTVSCTISVVFNPTAAGQRTAGVAITSDARGSVPVVTLSGTGLAVGLDLSSSLLIFDNQTVGTTSASQTVTLSNSGATAIAITSISATGDFAQTNTCGNSIAASANCTIKVTFTPTGTGTRTGAVNILAADSTTPHVVTLTGTGVVVTLSLSPASLTFNDQKVGTSSQAQSIALTNMGGAALAINSIVPAGDFLELDNCGSGLAAGAGCSINVTFVPTATGIRTGSITVTSNAQGSPHTIKLSGNGISLGPAVSLACPGGSGGAPASSCASLTFAAQAVSTTSAARLVSLTNVGNDTLNITGIAASGDFTALSNCPAALSASASCSINLTFTPSATGPRAGSLVIKDNAGDSPQSVSLSGTGTPSGPAISLSASALPFGSQFVGTMSNSQLVTVSNPGNATLTFTSIKASGDFTETDTCANGVSANSSCTISVIFAPTATGARAGAITISDNAPGSPHSVTLSGEGTDVIISVPPGGSSSATVSAGQSATFALSVAPAGGFNGSVTVSCNSAIPASTCTPSPGSLTLSAPVTITTTVTTTAPSHSAVVPAPWLLPHSFAPLRVVTLTLLLLVALLTFSIAASRRRRTWIAVTAAFLLAAFVSGCAGGYRNPGVVGPTLGTAPNTYTITVVITTPSGATRSIPLTVIVQ
jgi:uncharacterized repeat protein (TIGR01451 family)